MLVTAVAEITCTSLVLSRRQHFTSVLPFLQLVHSVSLSCCSCVLERIIQRSYLECIVNSHVFLALWPVMRFCVNWRPGPKETLMMRVDKMPNLCLTQERKSMQMKPLSWCCQNFMFCHGSSCNASFFSWYLLLLPTAALAGPANSALQVRSEKFSRKSKVIVRSQVSQIKIASILAQGLLLCQEQMLIVVLLLPPCTLPVYTTSRINTFLPVNSLLHTSSFLFSGWVRRYTLFPSCPLLDWTRSMLRCYRSSLTLTTDMSVEVNLILFWSQKGLQ